MILRPSGPAQAMRSAAVVLVMVIAARLPAMRDRFRQTMAAGDRAATRPASKRDMVASSSPSPHRFAEQTKPAVVGMGDTATSIRLAAGPEGSFMVLSSTRRASAVSRHGSGGANRVTPPTVAGTEGTRPLATRAGPPLVENGGAATPTALIASVATSDGGRVSTAGGGDATAAFDLATAAYARLAAGDRRGAARLFDAALAGDDPRATTWRRQRDALNRHWSGSAYSIVRDSGSAALTTEPVLGGGQSGGSLAYTLDPLDRRPLAVFARGSIAHDDGGRTSFAAVGVQWRPLPGVTVAAERLIATGPAGPNDWSVRLGAGIDRTYGRVRATAYGEGGVIGSSTYAATQGRLAGIFHLRGIEIDPGAGVWSSVQHDHGPALDRVDTGPGVLARAGRFGLEADYRVRVAGNAAPGSGPVLTLTAGF